MAPLAKKVADPCARETFPTAM